MTAGSALVVGGVLVGGTVGAASAATTAALKDVLSKHNTSVSKAGCYAGPDWPFRTQVQPYRVVGAPIFKPAEGEHCGLPEINGRGLRIVRGGRREKRVNRGRRSGIISATGEGKPRERRTPCRSSFRTRR